MSEERLTPQEWADNGQPCDPNCDRSACGDYSPGRCDNPDCPALSAPFAPDWVSPPGDTTADVLEERGWTQAERQMIERCAEVCESQATHTDVRNPERVEYDPASTMAKKCASPIRALGAAT